MLTWTVLPTCLMVPTRPMRVNSAMLRIVFLHLVGLRPDRSREFWRRRRGREECRSGPRLRGDAAGENSWPPGADVPSTAIGIQPCNRERQHERRNDTPYSSPTVEWPATSSRQEIAVIRPLLP